MNLVLTGFMGTGKSTVGQILAGKLNRDLVDMDNLIEQQTGQTINDIFAQHGEGYFRQLERDLALDLSQQNHLIIATGGGTLVDDLTRDTMLRTSLVVCLTASLPILVKRLKHDTSRPLLLGEDPTRRIEEILASRRDAYAKLPYHINTDLLTPEATAEAVLKIWHKHSI